MRESIGSTALYNIIIVFIAIIFSLIIGTLVYYKAFKVNKAIISSIEKYEGYNPLAIEEINSQLSSIGYLRRDLGNCPKKKGETALENTSGYSYCVYRFVRNKKYYAFGVISYVVFDMPFVDANMFKFAIYAETDDIYRFGG